MIRRLMMLAVPLLLLAGCGEDMLDGTVTDKGVDPGFVFIQQIPSTSCSGKVCTTTYIPITYYAPECRWVVVKGETDEASGKTCLSDSRWETVNKGDHYTGADVAQKDRKREKN